MKEAVILVHLHPDDKGIAYDKWLLSQPLCDPKELEKYMRDQAALKQAKSAKREKR